MIRDGGREIQHVSQTVLSEELVQARTESNLRAGDFAVYQSLGVVNGDIGDQLAFGTGLDAHGRVNLLPSLQ